MATKKYAGGGHLESTNDTQSFKSAFAEARDAGAGTFTWRGKKYGVELAKPAAEQAKAPAAEQAKAPAAAQSTPEKAATPAAARPAAARPKPTRSSTDMATLDRLRDTPVPSDDVLYRQARKTAPVKVSAANSNEEPIATFKRGGFISSASKRADGIAQRGKTRA